MINCNELERAAKFYTWLMPKIGYERHVKYDQPAPAFGWFGDGGSVWLMQATPELRGDRFDKRRVGIREIAFRAESRAQIDEVSKEIAAQGGKILDAPREYNYAPGYYSVFFTDPDGVKLELVHVKR